MKKFIFSLWNTTRALTLFGCFFTYLLGGGIVHYLGYSIEWVSYALGLGIIILLVSGGYFLNTYYGFLYADQPDGFFYQKRNKRVNKRKELDDEDFSPLIYLQAAITVLSIVTVLVFLVINRGYGNVSTYLFILITFVIVILFAVPPFRLVNSGYGELCEAFLVANLSPALAFSIQTGGVHRLLVMLTFPLTLLFLAMLLAVSLPSYAEDIKNHRKNLIIRIGSENGFILHNYILICAYLLLGIAFLMGLPWRLTWPALLTIPVALLQISLIISISRGGKPAWNLLLFTSVTTFMLTTYLITFTLWIN